jgi:hypothetical protein
VKDLYTETIKPLKKPKKWQKLGKNDAHRSTESIL